MVWMRVKVRIVNSQKPTKKTYCYCVQIYTGKKEETRNVNEPHADMFP